MKKNSPDNQGIVFRRIRGRIVPIRTNKLSSEEKKGLAIVAGSAAGGVVGGTLAGGAIQMGNKLQRVSRFKGVQAKHIRRSAEIGQLLLGETGGKFAKRHKGTWKLSEEATKLSKVARKLRTAGKVGAVATGFAVLVGLEAGLEPIVRKRVTKEENGEPKVKTSFLINTASTAIAAGITLLGAKTVGARKAARLFKNKVRKP